VECRSFREPPGLRDKREVVVEVVVADTGCGIPAGKLESIFKEFEKVDNSWPQDSDTGLGRIYRIYLCSGSQQSTGLGLAVVARIVQQLGGQLRVESKEGVGSRFSLLMPFLVDSEARTSEMSSGTSSRNSLTLPNIRQGNDGGSSTGSAGSEIDIFVEALGRSPSTEAIVDKARRRRTRKPRVGHFEVEGSKFPVRSLKLNEFAMDPPPNDPSLPEPSSPSEDPVQATNALKAVLARPGLPRQLSRGDARIRLRLLVVDVSLFVFDDSILRG
jgi:hypothetical protein